MTARASDEQVTAWVAAAKAGDARAFNRLVEHHQDWAHHVAYGQLSDPEDAADCTQEAMLKAWRALDGFSGDGRDFRSWLARIVVNTCRDRLRYERRRPRVPLEIEVDGQRRPMPLPSPDEPPDRYAERADLRALIERATAQLPPERREVLLLDQGGFSYKEMADALGLPLGTVRSRLYRARADMRELLTGRTDGAAEEAAPEPSDDARRLTSEHEP